MIGVINWKEPFRKCIDSEIELSFKKSKKSGCWLKKLASCWLTTFFLFCHFLSNFCKICFCITFYNYIRPLYFWISPPPACFFIYEKISKKKKIYFLKVFFQMAFPIASWPYNHRMHFYWICIFALYFKERQILILLLGYVIMKSPISIYNQLKKPLKFGNANYFE